MILQFKVKNIDKDKSTFEVKKVFKSGGKIGRDPDCNWVIHDPLQYVSGKHALIERIKGNFYITDISTNGVFIQGTKIPKNEAILLSSGDELRIGKYFIDVQLFADEEELLTTPLPEDDLSVLDTSRFFDNLHKKPLSSKGRTAPFHSVLEEPKKIKKGAYAKHHKIISHETIVPMELPKLSSQTDFLTDKEGTAEAQMVDSLYNDQKTQTKPKAAATHIAYSIFLHSLGLNQKDVEHRSPEYVLEAASYLLFEFFTYLTKVAHSRKKLKNPSNSSLSQVVTESLNPFKHYQDIKEVSLKIFSNLKDNTWKNPILAVREIFYHDIMAHDEATASSWNAVANRLIESLNPEFIEKKIERSLIHKIMTYKHKAQCWDLAKEEFTKISNTVEQGELLNLFHEEFEKIYNKKVNERKNHV
ncbi:MAG: type VI secretion system-associated FHA domain protein TagH [Bdellovibrionota bacterium]